MKGALGLVAEEDSNIFKLSDCDIENCEYVDENEDKESGSSNADNAFYSAI